MPFALYSGIIVATIRAPCGDCNVVASLIADLVLLQFAPPCGDCNISGLAYIDTSIPAAIRTPCRDYDESASVSNETCDM